MHFRYELHIVSDNGGDYFSYMFHFFSKTLPGYIVTNYLWNVSHFQAGINMNFPHTVHVAQQTDFEMYWPCAFFVDNFCAKSINYLFWGIPKGFNSAHFEGKPPLGVVLCKSYRLITRVTSTNVAIMWLYATNFSFTQVKISALFASRSMIRNDEVSLEWSRWRQRSLVCVTINPSKRWFPIHTFLDEN